MSYIVCTNAATVALSSAYAVLTAGSTTTNGGTVFQDECTLVWVNILFTGGAGLAAAGTATLTWKLSWDLAGDLPFTPETVTTIVFGQTTATSGSATAKISLPVVRPVVAGVDVGTAGRMYLWAKLDQGTATGSVLLTCLAPAEGI